MFILSFYLIETIIKHIKNFFFQRRGCEGGGLAGRKSQLRRMGVPGWELQKKFMGGLLGKKLGRPLLLCRYTTIKQCNNSIHSLKPVMA